MGDLTPWFDGTVKPARPGVYERLSEEDELHDFSRWDGRRWMCGQNSPEEADNLVMCESQYQPHHGQSTRFKWRGFTRRAAMSEGGERSQSDPPHRQPAP